MEYKKIEEWILNRLPFYQNNGAVAYNPGLNNIDKFINELNLSNNQLKFIHVGGTNGKGSTCSYISSILQESNYKVGIFTSPHYYDYRERIKINNHKIEKSYITSFIKDNKTIIEEIGLSFFELSFGLSLSYFKQNKVDYAIIEVGLGGRLDATNIINPLVSVVTNISYDHTEILGDTLEKIAVEKAGIIKEKSQLIVGERNKLTDEIFINKCKEKSTEITFVPDIAEDVIYSEIDYLNKNIKTSIETCKALNLNRLNSKIITKGIENVDLNSGLFGRWSIMGVNPMIIFDSAHNESGFISIADQISKISYNKIYVLLSFVKGKKIKDLIRHLPEGSNIYFTSLKIERSMDLEEINLNFSESIKFDENPKRIFNNIKNESSKDDLILVTGSNYIAKEIFNEN
ncbi:MAG: bifunctional folylpolyglutamate synthase/dihydrofolate synthase [Cryomorphaceae bacterium]|nr:bifunctional folylpolyglutamate synthase/dihydrofolate synthase [Cryomorphaceae bacterium]MBT4293457.1 bifunctional folylpolyglutamate synthase/dihydrofolate synthase [Cryomorphaceae bacterium]MBT4517979.1 bifunctional folylpolyglutamate synthase/dihydrofolate synthase [Cryomorphaceae bacterium]MBT5937168.1 bifunctional folylpolyglutamate synthase/dihydrofolate synthase [Cryomorphaceae bacterium]MBT6213918.1 bifunctional folylpolyglutamate synthase/dihydrofolate synthase [Cryomorphaceae bact